MSEIIYTIRRLFVSFRDSVSGLLDSNITADDLKGLLWLAVIGLVVVVVSSILRAFDKRRPMR
jgi:hypothetical protein